MVRFKTIYIESLDTAASIPLMTDGIINVSLIYVQRESDLLIRVSYHTQTAFDKHERAPEPLPWNSTGIPLLYIRY